MLVDHTEQEWYDATKALIEDPFARKQLAVAARKDVRERYPVEKACEAWEDVFSIARERASRGTRPSKRHSPKGVKKVFYIGSGFLWPHTYIDDFLVSAFSALGLEVVYCPLSPTPFHKEALAHLVFGAQMTGGFI